VLTCAPDHCCGLGGPSADGEGFSNRW
jgi:hypothetical protein